MFKITTWLKKHKNNQINAQKQIIRPSLLDHGFKPYLVYIPNMAGKFLLFWIFINRIKLAEIPNWTLKDRY